MLRSLISFTFILTHAVLAQASENGSIHVGTQQWITTYAAEAEVEGLPVLAHLDESTLGIEIPRVLSDASGDTVVPSDVQVLKRSYRLNFIVSENPRVEIGYPVEQRMISIDGSPRKVFVNDLTGAKGIHFVIATDNSGRMHVNYTRTEADGNLGSGDFVLMPVLHTFDK